MGRTAPVSIPLHLGTCSHSWPHAQVKPNPRCATKKPHGMEGCKSGDSRPSPPPQRLKATLTAMQTWRCSPPDGARRTLDSPRGERGPDSSDRKRAPVNRVLPRPDKPGFLPSRVGPGLTKESGALPLYGLGSQGLPGRWEFPVLALAGVF